MRQLNIEDAARATKIRPRQLADLEADEYSNFANLAYARGFLVGYAKFLHVDVRSNLEAFEDANTFGLDDYQYLSEAPVGVYRAPSRPLRRKRRKRRLLAAATTLAALAAMVTLWFFVVSYQRLGGDLGDLAARQEARVRAAHEAGAAVSANVATPGTGALDTKPVAPLPPAEIVPVSVPVSSSPAPSSPVPAPERIVTTSAALASTENATVVPVGSLALPSPSDAATPAVPLPGDGAAARALTRGPDLRATLAGAPAGLNDRDPAATTQAKVLANKPLMFDSAKRPGDQYQASAPQTVSNDAVR